MYVHALDLEARDLDLDLDLDLAMLLSSFFGCIARACVYDMGIMDVIVRDRHRSGA